MKKATSSVLEEKNLERVELTKKLQDERTPEAEQAQLLKDLETAFEAKQKEAEQKAVEVIEQENMRAQMTLRKTARRGVEACILAQ